MPAVRPVSLSLAVALALTGPLTAVDGELDSSFGVLPGVTFWGGGTNTMAFADGDLVPDGRIFAVGEWDDPGTAQDPLLAWVEFDRDGAPVVSCEAGTNGPIPGVAESHLLAAHVTAAGKLLVAGTAYLAASPTVARALVAQIDPAAGACVLDDTFHFDGWDLFDEPAFCAGASCAILDTAAIRTSTGAVTSERTVLLLRANTGFLTSRLFLVALQTTGYLDTAFGDAGFAELTASGLGQLLGAGPRLDVDARGRIWLLAARLDPVTATDADVVLARFLPDGTLDASFDGDGIALVDDHPDYDSVPAGLAVHGDLGVSLAFRDVTSNVLSYCYRPAGGAQTCGTQGPIDYRGMVAQGDGKLLQTFDDGAPSYSLTVTRTIPPFGGDDTFGANGPGTTRVEINLGGANDEAPRAIALGDGRPLIFGVADQSASTRAGIVVRLTNAYLFADGFEAGTAGEWTSAVGLP